MVLQRALRDNPMLRESFLRCASRVRQLYVSQVTGPDKGEVRLLQRLLTWGNGATFLPGLVSLSWIESPETDRLLPILVPTCLEHLELSDLLLCRELNGGVKTLPGTVRL